MFRLCTDKRDCFAMSVTITQFCDYFCTFFTCVSLWECILCRDLLYVAVLKLCNAWRSVSVHETCYLRNIVYHYVNVNYADVYCCGVIVVQCMTNCIGSLKLCHAWEFVCGKSHYNIPCFCVPLTERGAAPQLPWQEVWSSISWTCVHSAVRILFLAS